MTASASPLLGARGQIFVSLAAATAYRVEHLALRPRDAIQPEEARRELTELLVTARCTQEAEPGGVAHYRARARATQLDISATVVQEGRLLVVVSVHVRDYR